MSQLTPRPELEPDFRDYEPIHPEPAWRSLARKIWAPLVVLLGVIVKFGFAFAKFASIFVAVGGYALIWGWRFGLGFVLLILVHELGHYVEAKRQGLNPQIPVFIPFIGAYVALREPAVRSRGGTRSSRSPGRWQVASAPLVCLIYGSAIDSDLLRALAYVGFFLNLINLVPIAFLDGGHILRAWRVLRAARRGGSNRPAEARRLAGVVAAYSVALAAGARDRHGRAPTSRRTACERRARPQGPRAATTTSRPTWR